MLKEGTPPCPRAWRDARGETRQENQQTEIRKRKGNEIEKERKKIKQGNAISSQILRNQYASRKSQNSQGTSRVGVFFYYNDDSTRPILMANAPRI